VNFGERGNDGIGTAFVIVWWREVTRQCFWQW